MALTNDRRRRTARTADRSPVTARPGRVAAPASVRTPFGAALPAALWSAALGLAVVTVLVIVGWAAAPDTGVTAGAAASAGGQAWLLAQGADLMLPDGTITLTPLGLLLLPAFVLVRSGRWAARAADVRSWADAARTVGLIALLYAVVGLGVAFAAATPVVRPQPWTAFAGTGLVALLASGWGVLRGSGLAAVVPAALPRQAVPLLRGTTGGLAVLVAGGGLFVAVSLLAHGGQVGGLWSGLELDPAGAALLLLLSCALIPNAILWACAYVVGPGFAVGVGTSVAPTGIVVGAVPALPLLGALPGAGDASLPSLLGLLLPVVAGVGAGILVARDPVVAGDDAARTALLAAGAGALAGLGLGLLASLSAGALGAGRMADLGPAGVPVALVTSLEMAVVAAAVCWEWRRHVARRAQRTVDLRSS